MEPIPDPDPTAPDGAFARILRAVLERLGNYLTSVIRTGVPIVVGIAVSFATRHGLNIDEAEVTAWMTPLAIGGYYALVRWAEVKVDPRFGWLLGIAKQPGYNPEPAPPAQAAPAVELVKDQRLGRRPEFDVRSAQYPIRTLLDSKAKLRSYTWPLGAVLDQGTEGACVGFSITHELMAKPVAVAADDAFAFALYRDAQKIDQWPGEDYSGTSVLAGMKAAAALGYFDEYRWAFGVEDVVRALSSHGPVVFGLDWYEGMFNPDDRGFIHPTGQVAGGHAICGRGLRLVKATATSVNVGTGVLAGIDLDRSYVLLHNSWGPGWGDQGTAKVSLFDLSALLKAGGECAIPVRRLKPVAA